MGKFKFFLIQRSGPNVAHRGCIEGSKREAIAQEFKGLGIWRGGKTSADGESQSLDVLGISEVEQWKRVCLE